MPKRKVKEVVEAKSKKITFERIPSGVPGLDRLIEGGYVKGSSILVSGSAGTGKTIFGVQFLLEGVRQGEKVLFITLGEPADDIRKDVIRFGWDLEKLENEKKFFLKEQDPFRATMESVTNVADEIKDLGAKRVVIDSSTAIGLYTKDAFQVRKTLFQLLTAIRKVGATVMFTSEISEDSKILSSFGMEEFISDAVIILHYLGIGESIYNSIQVRKMRRTKHEKDIYPMEIGENGIIIKKVS